MIDHTKIILREWSVGSFVTACLEHLLTNKGCGAGADYLFAASLVNTFAIHAFVTEFTIA